MIPQQPEYKQELQLVKTIYNNLLIELKKNYDNQVDLMKKDIVKYANYQIEYIIKNPVLIESRTKKRYILIRQITRQLSTNEYMFVKYPFSYNGKDYWVVSKGICQHCQFIQKHDIEIVKSYI